MCIDIVDICFGIANGRISSILTELSARNTSVFYFQDNKLSQSQWIFTKFICPWHYNGGVFTIMTGYYRFTFYLLLVFTLTVEIKKIRELFYLDVLK